MNLAIRYYKFNFYKIFIIYKLNKIIIIYEIYSKEN